ncbi:hypothetical protein F4782DRAFT_516684 [Xylaria castorea]|nr:hypothetical protein F4782DRAFT_516684 [Xylaria castorea]
MTPIKYSGSAQEPVTSLPPNKASVNFVKEHQLRLAGTSMRAEFPKHLVADLAWNGADIMPNDYIYRLSDLDQMEIDDALHLFLGEELDGDLVDCTNFPLPNLGPRLQEFSLDLHYGKGFFLIRGFNHEKYSVEATTIIFLGIQAYIAEKRGRQDELGNMIVHIRPREAQSSLSSPVEHSRHSNVALPFHTDWGDILAFHTRSSTPNQGNCVVSSAYTIYNVLAKSRPDIIQTLARADWPFTSPYPHRRPILFYCKSKLIMNFQPDSLFERERYPRPLDFPRCTAAQIKALEVVQAVAEAHSYRFTTQTGDFHFINNLAILHGREEFSNDQGNKRHLVRMWLRNEELGWDIPDVLETLWAAIFEGDANRTLTIEPMPERFFPLKRYPN